MNGSPVGTQLTTAIMAAGTIGFTGGGWQELGSATGMTVGAHHYNLPCPLTVKGMTYPVTHPSQSIAYNNAYNYSSVDPLIPGGHSAITAAGYITFGLPNLGTTVGNNADLISTYDNSGHFSVLQLDNGNPIYGVRIETDGNGTIRSPNIILTPGATYWYSIKTDFGAGMAYLNVYDLSGNLVGSVSVQTIKGGTVGKLYIGQEEKASGAGTTTYFEQTVLDYTHAAVPLICK
jgi:hypothetical protein